MAESPARLLAKVLRWTLGAALSFWLWGAQAAPTSQAAPATPDPALEKHALQLAGELRCLVCQNQSIADSQAPLAVELKNQVYEQLARGQSDQDVIDFMVQRYGDFVLYRPPVKASTWLLWFSPFLLLGLGLLALMLKLCQKPAAQAETLTAAELAHAAALLAGPSLPGEAAPTVSTPSTA